MWKKINQKFDIIVDDGLHNFYSNINFFSISFKYLKKGGVYFIEDVQLKNTNSYKQYFNNKKIPFEIIYFENLNYSNHCIIKIVK